VVQVIKRAGLCQPKQRFRVRVQGRTYELDLAWPEAAIAIEFDGWEVHGTSVTAFHRDRERWRALQRAGWTVYHVTSRKPESEILAIASLASARSCAS
jgi:very-short-patch-repair endonuclease